MLTGVVPNRHAILWNGDLETVQPVYPRVPTLFEMAKNSGYTTALAAGKTKFSFLNKPETIDHVALLDAKEDALVAEAAAEMIREHRPSVLFVHMPVVDMAGHRQGWGTAEQLAAVEQADAALGVVLEALREAELMHKTLIILTADHGGAGKTHGPDDPRSRTIPWIAAGPGIRENYDLTRLRELEINTEDTCATALAFLDITPKISLDGKPITQIVEERELLSDAPSAPSP